MRAELASVVDAEEGINVTVRASRQSRSSIVTLEAGQEEHIGRLILFFGVLRLQIKSRPDRESGARPEFNSRKEMTQYGTMYSVGDDRLAAAAASSSSKIIGGQSRKNSAGKTSKKFQKLIASKLRRHAEDCDVDDERVGLCTAMAADDDQDRISLDKSQVEQLRAKHRRMRGLWKGIVEAVSEQFYFMNVSIENTGGIYRATTVTRSDGTIATELRYYPSPTYMGRSSHKMDL